MGVQAALLHYVGKLRAGRKPLELPAFCRGQASQGPRAVIDLAVDAEIESMLELEAARQGITVSQLALHSVLIYLAELDFLTQPSVAGATRVC